MQANPNLRQALGHFATGVTIITSRDAAGQPIGVTVNSFNSVSLEPPLILWSLARRAYSFDTFATQRHFAVHILSAHQQHLSDRFARAGADKFADIELEEGLGGAPLLSDCAAVFQCQTEARYDGGDHLIVLGRVQAYHTREHPPLLFYRGRYARPAIAHGLGYDGATHHSHS
ncbi:MAG: flavin reductase family protein [Pigmentiphaga sp.]|nr:flavin reductase family protein [Pigmentiphaga sp.]